MNTVFTSNLCRRFTAVTAGALMITALGVAPAYAVDPSDQTIFELGPLNTGAVTNIVGEGAATVPDWADIFSTTPPTLFGGTAASFAKDDVSAGSATDTTAYPKGGSDKNSGTISSWTWQSASVPAKDDISNAYVYAKIVNGHLIIYGGVERLDPSGSSHVDLEFFQNPVGLSQTPPCTTKGGCTFTGTNRDNDILVNMDYAVGGSFAGVSIRKRHEGVQNNYDLIQTLGGQGCNGTNSATNTICAFANGASIDGGPWDNFDNHGAIITNLQTNSFTEFGIDVTALLGTTPCFSSVAVKTRSSGSFTAELKDFALGSFEQCTASAATQIHSGASVGATHISDDIQGTSVAVGTTVHDKAIVTGTIGFATPTGTVTFNRFANSTCAGTAASTQTVTLTQTVAFTPTTAGTAAAESSSFAPGAGPLSYQAVYNGDSNYPTPVTSACEPLTVNRTNSAVNTDIRLNTENGVSVLNLKINNGTTVVDVATITGVSGLPDPTGTVTFQRFTSANCSGNFTSQDVTLVTDADPVDFTATAVSSTYTTTAAAGEFVSYKVIYSGDTVYNPATASVCEPLCSFSNSPTLP